MDFRFNRLEQIILEKTADPCLRRDRKLNEKINLMANKLKTKKVFDDRDLKAITHLSPLPVPAA